MNLDAYRLAKQNDLSTINYHDLMMDNMDEVTNKRLQALNAIDKDKARVARAYNKKVKKKLFQVEELMWKTILPIEVKDNKFSKWSPSGEEDREGYHGEFIHDGDIPRCTFAKSFERPILEKVSP